MMVHMPTVERELITTGQAIEMLGISRSTIGRMVRRGELPVAQQLPGRKGKGAYLFDPDVIEAERQRRLERALETVTALEGT